MNSEHARDIVLALLVTPGGILLSLALLAILLALIF